VVTENVQTKGRRLLTEGRLTVRAVDPVGENGAFLNRSIIIAECKGDSGKVYKLGYDMLKKEWRCTCEARGVCSHLVALQLVTVSP
jgi:hypothetical protein